MTKSVMDISAYILFFCGMLLNDKLRMKPADDESKIDDEFSLRQTMAMNSRPTMTTLIGMIYFGIFEHENAMHF
ncbi:hypothetical protein RCL_jg14410.t2 [Rhizophagus clarus]|uniref:Uncharacterized protein n=1 Tax=Rhizophagus clarus TaxID=94130 RepID=A0A8H3LQM6_9GLOM|nr:hypothetical protein RCL_jg14410.t2 [Rhizophagus clarus]